MNRRLYKYLGVFFFLLCLTGYKVYYVFSVQTMQSALQTQYVSFDESMQRGGHEQALQNNFSSSAYAVFRELYEKNNFLRIPFQQSVKIPKIIHQIWLGSPFPEEYKQYQASWRKHHPDWEYKLWTDAEVKQLTLMNQDLYDASLNYGEKSDILRYELLYRYGGLYVDTDFECLKPLDSLHYAYDFYVGIQPLDTGFTQLGIGLIGAIPGHPLLKRCSALIRENKTRQIIARTGPIHCTTVFCNYAGKTGTKDVALPASYFYPCGYLQKGTPPTQWQRPESFAVHHWAASWTKPEGFVRRA